jgi:hypothetical protein
MIKIVKNVGCYIWNVYRYLLSVQFLKVVYSSLRYDVKCIKSLNVKGTSSPDYSRST